MSIPNPRVDFAFKKLFGTPENKDILISLINAIVSPEDQVVDLILLNPYNHKEYSNDKLSILDIKARDHSGQQFNIEMQITDQAAYTQRALYYWAKLYTNQLGESAPFHDLKKTICINLLNFKHFNQEPHYHHIFQILHAFSHKNYFEDLEIHFVELPKLNENATAIKTTLDRWINFLTKAHQYTPTNIPEQWAKEPAIVKAFQQLNQLFFDDNEREVYEARLKWLRDEASAIENAEQKAAEKQKRQIALSLLQQHIADNIILTATGLTPDELAQLKDSIP